MNGDILDVTIFTDEIWFHLEGCMTHKTENPHVICEALLHPLKIGFHKTNDIHVLRLNHVNHVYYVINNHIPFINQFHDDELTNRYFQQDNAAAHTANETMAFLKQFHK
ncbi:hypothetical protein BDFB_013709 [Asbolus verrucosus]|uniref:DDE 3 domain containing protein n=1 Tax=Asbolus verrucosus TaxID=1661398 RepID=A0A482V785_ASBVE|nr:hypothetical protein BDFB_013709 [Asbolus verrucosus]